MNYLVKNAQTSAHIHHYLSAIKQCQKQFSNANPRARETTI